jgi:hypothetical protein
MLESFDRKTNFEELFQKIRDGNLSIDEWRKFLKTPIRIFWASLSQAALKNCPDDKNIIEAVNSISPMQFSDLLSTHQIHHVSGLVVTAGTVLNPEKHTDNEYYDPILEELLPFETRTYETTNPFRFRPIDGIESLIRTSKAAIKVPDSFWDISTEEYKERLATLVSRVLKASSFTFGEIIPDVVFSDPAIILKIND